MQRNVLGTYTRSFEYRERAQRVLGKGVSSTPRSSQRPVAIAQDSAVGCTVTDVDGNRYTDYVLGYGPLLLGHTPAPVLEAVTEAMTKGLRTGGVSVAEAELAEHIAECVPSAEVTSFLSSGTEAIQLALRVARAGTKRLRVIKFRGNYHGWSDSMHVGNAVGSDALTTAGQDPQAVENIILLNWGDIEAALEYIDETVAAVIVEPAAVNAGCFEPESGFLETLRMATRQHGVRLIFDEVITGFRLGLGGAQKKYGVTPDITVLGKVLGAGFPVSAVSGTRQAMEPVTSGTVLHRGTYNGNPVSMAAGIACLSLLEEHESAIYPRLEALGSRLASSVKNIARQLGQPLEMNHIGTCLQFFISDTPINRLSDLSEYDSNRTLAFSELLVDRGILTLPRGLMYLSTEHQDADITATIDVFRAALEEYAAGPTTDSSPINR